MALSTQPGTTGAVAQAQNSAHIQSPLSKLESAFLIFNAILGIGVVGCVVAVSDPWENLINTGALALVAVGTVGVSAIGWILSKRTSAAIAASNAEAKQALERAELAALELERLRAILRGRRIPPGVAPHITQSLSAIPRDGVAGIELMVNKGDPECAQFGLDVEAVFRSAQWRPNIVHMLGGPSGFVLFCHPELLGIGQSIGQAFAESGIELSVRAQEPDLRRGGPQSPLRICIGIRLINP